VRDVRLSLGSRAELAMGGSVFAIVEGQVLSQAIKHNACGRSEMYFHTVQTFETY